MRTKDRIHGSGELVWTDETRKTGALRLTLSDEEREQFRNWIEKPTAPVNAPVVPPFDAKTNPLPARPTATAIPAIAPLLTKPGNSVPASATRRPARRWTSRALFSRLDLDSVGFYISAFALTLALFFPYAPQIGNTFFRWGSRIAGKSVTQGSSPAVAPTDSDRSPAAWLPPVTSQSLAQLSAEIAALDDDSKANQTNTSVLPKHSPPVRSVLADDVVSSPPPVSSPTPAVSSAASNSPDANTPSSLGPSEGGAQDAETPTTASISLKYLDAGSFKNFLLADDTTDALSHLGFRAIIVHKGHLWMSSYHVLVGPFGNGDEVEAAKEKLEARGLTPRPVKP